MLDFCAEHGIVSEVEVIGADQVNEAYERVLASDVRYRFVIDAATICVLGLLMSRGSTATGPTPSSSGAGKSSRSTLPPTP